MQRYRRILGYALREWRALVMIVIVSLATSLMAAAQPWPVKLLVDYGLQGLPLPAQLAQPLAAFGIVSSASNLIVLAALASLIMFAVNSVIDVTLTWAWSSAGQRMVFDLATDLFRRLQRLSLAFHHRRGIGDSLSRLSTDTWCVYTVTESVLVGPAQRLLTIMMVAVVAWRLDAVLTTCALAVAPVLAISAYAFGKTLKRRTRTQREAQSRLATFVHQTLTAMPVVQAFRMERSNRDTFAHLASATVAAAEREATVKTAFGSVNAVLTTAGAAVVLFVGGERVLAQSLTIGTLLVFVGYLRTLQGAFEGLLGTYGQLRSVEASIDRVLELLDEPDEVAEAPTAIALPVRSRAQRGHIAFESVSFHYEPHLPVLQHVDLEIRPGETLALVGHSGAGKTTLASLIPRLFDPDRGCVYFDGIDVRRLKLKSLRSEIAVVLQDPFLLPLSIAENIAYGRPGARPQEVVAAAQAANAHEFIQALPQAYDTILGERGATLSGGQRQRLAIARALLKDAPVLILDEPTSALDPHTEALVVEALRRLVHGRTTVIIAHRLSTIRNADRIVVLDRGRVVETGSHAELMRRQERYFTLYTRQAGRAERAVA